MQHYLQCPQHGFGFPMQLLQELITQVMLVSKKLIVVIAAISLSYSDC